MAESTTAGVEALPAESALRAAHQRLLTDSSTQFDLPTARVQPQLDSPDWLLRFLHWLGEVFATLGPLLRWVFYIGLVAIAAVLIFLVVRSLMGANWPKLRRKGPTSKEPEWRPDAAKAKVLLEDADQLAGEGRFAEAARLLLHRSLDDVRGHRPKAIRPAVTSRELAVSEDLPSAARLAFSQIAAVVETSYFGERSVDQTGYGECRRAYEEFAFPGVWA